MNKHHGLTMSIRTRLVSLETSTRSRNCGPGCPPRPVVFVRAPDFYGSTDQRPREQEPPAPCPRCGRAAEPTTVRLVRDPDFFGTADRLKSLMT